jgi:hypothetical protein
MLKVEIPPLTTLCMTYQNWVLLGEKNIYPWFPSVTPVALPYSDAMAVALPVAEERVRWLISA